MRCNIYIYTYRSVIIHYIDCIDLRKIYKLEYPITFEYLLIIITFYDIYKDVNEININDVELEDLNKEDKLATIGMLTQYFNQGLLHADKNKEDTGMFV